MSKKDRRPNDGQKDDDPEAPGATSMVEVATELDGELRRFEELAATARRAPLSSQKSIERAVGVIRQAAESQGRLTRHLQALLGAMGGARDRVEAAAGSLNARADEIQQRSEEHTALLQRLAALGQEAMQIGAQAQGIGARKPREAGDGADPAEAPEAPGPDVIEEVRAVLQRLVALAQQADEAAKATDAAGLVDLARQADSLRQTLGAARQKVTLLERSLLANEPPRA